jgi:DNA-binding response OmpR family regulator
MKIIVVDRDAVTAQLIRSRLERMGHGVVEEPIKNNAVERLATQEFDAVFLDPSPLTSPRPVVLNIRRTMKTYPYVFLMSDSISLPEAMKAGVNDLFAKPLDVSTLEQKMQNAQRLIDLVSHMGDDSEDFPSAGGVIAKSAINQLFLSAIDRADRYGERTFLLEIALSNYKEIRDLEGPYAAEYIVAKLCQYLVLLRRQSDIIGQIDKFGYMLVLQRPTYETEPVEAAGRFAESLAKFEDIVTPSGTRATISVSLLDIPRGSLIVRHDITPGT